MKLTPDQIAAIEAFLTRTENGESLAQLGIPLFPEMNKAGCQAAISSFHRVMRQLGIVIAKPTRADELAQFRAWKAKRQEVQGNFPVRQVEHA